MAYFPNGASGDVYYEQWCYRCVNWREDGEGTENWGCIVWDLHLLIDYDQCDKSTLGQMYKYVLEHFIPTKADGFPDKCRMFFERVTADIPGQYKFAWDRIQEKPQC